ncbi:ShlB/FhaC/HecB family hemolysin secretion/activation protein [Pseudomonas ceruminis]|uniref:ShlB/FhaC/HecB family hemolysin secretion/activation protein n=1 Tax=Pseudomonas ceruminis TaxID=2740516 RepID=UPI004046CEAE
MRPLAVPLIVLLWASLAHAEPLPGYRDSHEYERRLPTDNLPVEAYRPVVTDVRWSAPRTTAPLSNATQLVLHKVRFEGGTVFPLSELREHYQPLIGREITVGELQQFTERLTQRYQRDGYPLSYAYLPPQDLAEGRVHVVLVEGYIHDYELLGDIGPAAAYLEQMMARLQAERPLTQAALERFTGLAQRMPGLSVYAEVAAAQVPGDAARLRLHVWRKPYAAGVTLTAGSRENPQALAKVSSNAQTRFAEQLTASFLLPPGDDRTHYQRLDYSQYLDAQGSQLLLSAKRYRSEPGTRVRLQDGTDLTQRRQVEQYAIGLGQALMVERNEWINLSGRLYSSSEHLEQRICCQREYDTAVRGLSFEGDWRKGDERRLRIVSAGVYQGLDYLGARSDADYDMDFLRFQVSGLQSDQLFDNWQGVVSAALYWSDDRLPDSERAVFGGQHFARGYPSDQAAGDKGWGVAYELNYRLTPGAGWLKVVQPYAVLDAAQAWYNGGPYEDAHMGSVALGVRLGDGHHGNVALEVARPLADEALDSASRTVRLMLNISYQLE